MAETAELATAKPMAQHVEKAIEDDIMAEEGAEAIDHVAEKKLRRKIDLFLMPTLWVLMIFSYIVRLHFWNMRVLLMDVWYRTARIWATQELLGCMMRLR